jgi:RimJ/RimL family protein N-acetyltransferase
MTLSLPGHPLRGTLVVLRPWHPDDAEWYVSARDDEVFRWTTEPRDLMPDDVRRAIDENTQRPAYAGFAITDAETGALLGNISLVPGDPAERSAEVSYWLAAEGRGRGVATDALHTVIRWAFEAARIERIELLTDGGNEASQRLARRLGFAADGQRGERLLFVLRRP